MGCLSARAPASSCAFLALVAIAGCSHGRSAETQAAPPKPVEVEFVHPATGEFLQTSVQPGSVQAFESVDLYAKVPGFLKTQAVDIGDVVKRGQVLAVLDVPELVSQVQRSEAGVEQAKSKVTQMQAHVTTATADRDAAKSAVVQAEAAYQSASAWVRYRALQLKRMKDLFASRSIEERLVDESKEKYEASLETERSANATVATSKTNVTAADAKILSAQADLAEARSEVKVTQADLTKSKVLVDFATITAPFNGVVTHRAFFVGDFIRSANEANNQPLLTVKRTDLMRVVVQIPDRDAPYVSVGDEATLEIDALRGAPPLNGKVSRMTRTQDPETRLMHVEVDMPNSDGKLRSGMYGKMTIKLDQTPNQLSIPSSCLVGKAQGGAGSVYVVRDNKAHLVRISIGVDNGVRASVMTGLSAEDQVIVQPGNGLAEGTPVSAAEAKS
jgi:HlyD family secretion protein